MERDLISQTQPEHGGTSKESSGGTSFQPLTSITTRISANATGTPIPPRLTPNPTLKPPTLTPISSSPPPPLTPAPSFPASLTPKTATPPALIPFPPKLTPTPNLPLPTQTLHLLPTSARVTTPPSSTATSPSLNASPPSLTPSSASPPITSLPPSTVTHNNVNSSSPKTSSILTNGKTRPSPTPTSTPITPFHTPASPTGKQLSESRSLGSPRPVPSNQSTPPVSRVSQKALLLGKRLQSSRRDQVLLRAEMLQNLTLRPPPPGTLNIPSSLRLKPPSSAPPPLPLPRSRTPIFPPLRPRPHPTSTATDSQTTPSQHLSVPPPTLYSSVRSVPLRPRLHSPSSYRAVPPRQSPALRPIAAATAKHAPPMKRLWTGLASCPSSPSQLRPSQSQHISLSSSHPLNSTSCFERSPSAARQLQIIALSSGRQSQPSNSAHAHASVQSQPSDSAHAHASVQSQPSNSAHAHASVQSQPSVQDSPQLICESQRTLSAEKYNLHPPKALVCKTPSTLPSAPALLSPPAPCLRTSPPNPSQKQKEEEGSEGAREAPETRRESHSVREEREGARERSGEERQVGEMEDPSERGKTAEEMDGERERTADDKEDQKKERAGGEESMEGAEDRMETCQEAPGGERMDVDRSHTLSKSPTGLPQQHCHVNPEPDKNQDQDRTSPTQTLLDPAKKTRSIDKVNLCESLSAQSDNLSALSSLSSQSPPSSPPILPPPDRPPPLLPTLSTHLSSPPSLSQAQSETFSESQPGPWAQKVWPEGGRRVLTHLVEGFVIQEGLQPFPVNRSSLLVQEEVGVTQNSNGANGAAHVPLTDTIAPSAHSSDSDEEGGATDDPMTLGVGPREKKAVLYCQFCAKRGHAHNFMRSKRFCSTACARGYNVGLTKRLRALSAGSRAEGRSSSSGLKRAMSVPGKPLLLRLPRDLWSAHRHDHKDEEEEDPAVSMTTRLGRRAGRRRERRASEPAMTSEPCVTSLLRPAQWSVEQVCDFINTLQGCGEVSEAFRLQEIDGQALLLLTEDHLMTSMNIKLGPALKICAHINTLKHP